MPLPSFLGNLPGEGATLQDLIDHVAELQKTVEFLLSGNLDTANAREFGGWFIGKNSIASRNGVVGLSSAITGSDDIRMWAGDAVAASAAYRVYESGHLYASDVDLTGKITANSGQIGGWTIGLTSLSGAGIISGGTINGSSITGASISGTEMTGCTITGGTIRTAASGNDRIELSGGKFQGLNSSEQITGLFFDIGTVAGTGIADLFLYHNGTKLIEFFDNITQYRIRGASGSTGMTLGGTAAPTYCDGSWVFNFGSSLDLSSSTVSGLSLSVTVTTEPGGADSHTHDVIIIADVN